MGFPVKFGIRNSSQVQCFIRVSRKTTWVSKVNKGGQLQEIGLGEYWVQKWAKMGVYAGTNALNVQILRGVRLTIQQSAHVIGLSVFVYVQHFHGYGLWFYGWMSPNEGKFNVSMVPLLVFDLWFMVE